MLRIKVEGSAGMCLRDQLMPEMLALAIKTGCSVECQANETKFVVYPTDTINTINDAYDRLYPESTIVMSGIRLPFRREKK